MATSSAEPARLEAYPDALAGADEQLTTLASNLDGTMSEFVAGAGRFRPPGFDSAGPGDSIRDLRDESRYLADWVARIGAGFRAADTDADGDGIFEADDGFLSGLVGPASMAAAMRIPEADADPAAVAQWWAMLPPFLRDRLIEDRFQELGALRGLPAPDTDRINRLRLADDIETIGGRLDDVNAQIDQQLIEDGQVDQALLDERGRLQVALSNARKIDAQMSALDTAYADSGPQPYLLTYSPDNAGRFAVALGNPDTADNTAVVVPGTSHDVRYEPGLFGPVEQGRVLYDEMYAQSGPATGPGGTTNSVIIWMGADMPDNIPQATDGTYGDSAHGAARLRDDMAGYQAAQTQANVGNTHMPSSGHVTVVAHSYGSYLTGEAVKSGMEVDDFVNIGSPGIEADNAGEMGMANEHVWAGSAEGVWWGDGDVVGDTMWHGTPPTDEDFGATVFDTSDSAGHSEYYKEGSQSLRNIGRIAVGRYDDVERRAPDDYNDRSEHPGHS